MGGRVHWISTVWGVELILAAHIKWVAIIGTQTFHMFCKNLALIEVLNSSHGDSFVLTLRTKLLPCDEFKA